MSIVVGREINYYIFHLEQLGAWLGLTLGSADDATLVGICNYLSERTSVLAPKKDSGTAVTLVQPNFSVPIELIRDEILEKYFKVSHPAEKKQLGPNPLPHEINAHHGEIHYRCRNCRSSEKLHWFAGTSCPCCDRQECNEALGAEYQAAYNDQSQQESPIEEEHEHERHYLDYHR